MRWSLPRLGVLAVAAGLAGGAPAVPAPAHPLVERLGDRDYARREAAERELDDLGPAARDLLRVGSRHRSPEVRERAGRVLARLERRLENEAALAPTLVELKLEDTPVADAVQSLARKTMIPIRLSDKPPVPEDRRVTLSTGRVPFWEALDLLCEKAGLREVPQTPVAATPPPADLDNPFARRTVQPADEGRAEPIVLELASTPQPRATVFGAARIRPVPAPAARPATVAPPAGAALVALDVRFEPRFRPQRLCGLSVFACRDAGGSTLPAALRAETVPLPPTGARRVVVVNGRATLQDAPPDGATATAFPLTPAVLCIGDGDSKPKRLKEFRGELTFRARGPAAELAAVPDALADTNTRVAGRADSWLATQGRDVLPSGEVELRVEYGHPPTVTPAAQLGPLGARVSVGVPGIELRDAAGRTVPYRGTMTRVNRAFRLSSTAATLRFRPPAGDRPAVRLSLVGVGPTDLVVPVRLTDADLK